MLPISNKNFKQARKCRMRFNLEKCTFGVRVGKFLGVYLTERGIEANPDKCRVLYPKFSPPIFHTRYNPRVSRIFNLAQKSIRQILFPGSKSAIRVLHFSKENWVFKVSNGLHRSSCLLKIYLSQFSNLALQVCSINGSDNWKQLHRPKNWPFARTNSNDRNFFII